MSIKIIERGHEWGHQVMWWEAGEKAHMSMLWTKFATVRTTIRSCTGVFNNLRQICKLAMEQDGEHSNELVIRMFQLKDWAEMLGQITPDVSDNSLSRSSDISHTFGGQYVPLSHEWTPDINWRGVEGM
jgi:hypothetical protein